MVHYFHFQDRYLVLDVNSCAFHEVDETAFHILSLIGRDQWPDDGLGKGSRVFVQAVRFFGDTKTGEVAKELSELHQQGLLYSEDPYADIASRVTRARIEDPVIKAMCLHVSHDCNLRCRYCFAGTGPFGGSRENMSPETAVKAIDFLISHSHGRKNLEVDFFGGEPLLAMDAVKAAVSYAEKVSREAGKEFHFTLTTNATLLDDASIEYINTKMGNVVLSLDGRPAVNDAMRILPDGKGTHEVIVDKSLKLVNGRNSQDYFVRGTFTAKNLDFSSDVLHMADLGFDRLSVEPVVSSETSVLQIHKKDLNAVFQEYEKLAVACVRRKREGRPFSFFHFEIDLDAGPCLYKRIGGCGAGVEYIAVTPRGEIYPCHQFAGKRNYLLGDLQRGITRPGLRKSFAGINIYSVEDCRRCWARFLCSGGCAAAAWQTNGKMDKPYYLGCMLERKRLECALWIKAEEGDDDRIEA